MSVPGDGDVPVRKWAIQLESAAGVAGLIQVILAMQRGVIPKHLHFRTPSPQMDRLPVP